MPERIDELLDEVAEAQVQAIWRPMEEGRSLAELTLPYGRLTGSFPHEGNTMHSSMVLVSPELRGNGIGERLMRSLGALTYKYGYTTMTKQVLSEYALDINKKVFGEDRLSYQSVNHGLLRMVVPRNYDSARKRLVRFGRRDPGRSSLRYWGINISVDLDGLDMSEWELPNEVPTNHLHR